MAVYLKNTKKDILMTEDDKEVFKNDSNCRFCEKEILVDKVRDHCHLASSHRGPAQRKCSIKVTQKQGKFLPFLFTILVIMIFIYF